MAAPRRLAGGAGAGGGAGRRRRGGRLLLLQRLLLVFETEERGRPLAPHCSLSRQNCRCPCQSRPSARQICMAPPPPPFLPLLRPAKHCELELDRSSHLQQPPFTPTTCHVCRFLGARAAGLRAVAALRVVAPLAAVPDRAPRSVHNMGTIGQHGSISQKILEHAHPHHHNLTPQSRPGRPQQRGARREQLHNAGVRRGRRVAARAEVDAARAVDRSALAAAARDAARGGPACASSTSSWRAARTRTRRSTAT